MLAGPRECMYVCSMALCTCMCYSPWPAGPLGPLSAPPMRHSSPTATGSIQARGSATPTHTYTHNLARTTAQQLVDGMQSPTWVNACTTAYPQVGYRARYVQQCRPSLLSPGYLRGQVERSQTAR